MKSLRWMIDATTLISFSESRVDGVDSVIMQTFLIDGWLSFPEKTNLIVDSSFLITYEHLEWFQNDAASLMLIDIVDQSGPLIKGHQLETWLVIKVDKKL